MHDTNTHLLGSLNSWRLCREWLLLHYLSELDRVPHSLWVRQAARHWVPVQCTLFNVFSVFGQSLSHRTRTAGSNHTRLNTMPTEVSHLEFFSHCLKAIYADFRRAQHHVLSQLCFSRVARVSVQGQSSQTVQNHPRCRVSSLNESRSMFITKRQKRVRTTMQHIRSGLTGLGKHWAKKMSEGNGLSGTTTTTTTKITKKVGLYSDIYRQISF